MKRFSFFALVLLLNACISTSEESGGETSAAVAEVPASPGLSGVSFTHLDGQQVDLSELTGKVVLINFWATWCGPCIKEMPSLQAFYNQYQGHPEVEFLVVEIDNQPELARGFVEKNKYTFPIYSPAGLIPDALLGQAIPTTVILNKRGEISFRHEGMSDFMADNFINLFQGILKQ